MHKWTKEDLDRFAVLYREHSLKDCSRIMGIPESVLKSATKNRKIHSGRTGQFKKGHVPFSKGQKMSPERYEKCKQNMFKKGNVPANYRPVGSERINVDGYIEIKTADPNIWELKHRVVYAQHFGELKKGDAIIMLNGDKTDLRPENLMKVTKSELARINQNKLHSEDTEISRSKALIGKLIAAKHRRSK